MSTRPPAVAGMFYPDSATSLGADLDALLAAADAPAAATPRALVVPHAGFVFSGPVAASAYATLRHAAGIRRVVVLGPSHRTWLQGMAVSSAEAGSAVSGAASWEGSGRSRGGSENSGKSSAATGGSESLLLIAHPWNQTLKRNSTTSPSAIT